MMCISLSYLIAILSSFPYTLPVLASSMRSKSRIQLIASAAGVSYTFVSIVITTRAQLFECKYCIHSCHTQYAQQIGSINSIKFLFEFYLADRSTTVEKQFPLSQFSCHSCPTVMSVDLLELKRSFTLYSTGQQQQYA